MVCIIKIFYKLMQLVTDRTFGSAERSVRPNCSAELLLCGSAQMTELFSAEHRTFFTATFHINDPHVRSVYCLNFELKRAKKVFNTHFYFYCYSSCFSTTCFCNLNHRLLDH